MRGLGVAIAVATACCVWWFSWPAHSSAVGLLGLSGGLIIAGQGRRSRSHTRAFSPASNGESPTTAERVATYTGSKPDGRSQAAEATPLTPRLLSSSFGSGASGAALASRLGTPTTAAGDCGCPDAAA